MSMFLGLYFSKMVTYLYDVAPDAMLYCWVATYSANEVDHDLVLRFQKKLANEKGYTLLEIPIPPKKETQMVETKTVVDAPKPVKAV